MTATLERIPDRVGTSFRVKSTSQATYQCTLVHRGPRGLIVRLADRRLARLDPARLDWSSLEVTGEDPVVMPGDDVTIVLAGSQVRGLLAEPPGDEVAVRTPAGREQRYPAASVREVLLSFRARDLQAGDRFVVRSRSGNYYRGRVDEARPDGTSQVTLEGGARVTMHWTRLDPESLVVLVPVSVAPRRSDP